MRLLERLLQIIDMATFAAVYDRVTVAITYDTGDGDDARLILEAMDDYASEEGFDDAAALVAAHRGEGDEPDYDAGYPGAPGDPMDYGDN